MFSVSDALRKTFSSTINLQNAYGVLLGQWGGDSCNGSATAVGIDGCLPLTLPKDDADAFKTLDILYSALVRGGSSSLPVGVVALGKEGGDNAKDDSAGCRHQILLEAIATSALKQQQSTAAAPNSVSLLAFTSLKQLVESSGTASTTTTAIPPILLQYSFADSSSQQHLTKKASPYMLPKNKSGTAESDGGEKGTNKVSKKDESLASLMLKSQPQGNVLVCATSVVSATQIHTTVKHAAENANGLAPPPLVLSVGSDDIPCFYLPVTHVVAKAEEGASASLELILWLHKSKKDDDGEGSGSGVPRVITCSSMTQMGDAPSSSSEAGSVTPLYFGPIERFVVSTNSPTSTSNGCVYWVCVGGDQSADVLYLPIALTEDEKKDLIAAFNPKVVTLCTLDGNKVSPVKKTHGGCCGPPSGPDVKTAPAWAVYLLTAAMVLSTAIGMGLIISGGQEEVERRSRVE